MTSTAVYVGNAGASAIAVLLLDPPSGGLQPLGHVPVPGVAVAGSSTPMAFGPGGRVLHIGLRGDPLVAASFAIDPATGALNHLGNGPLADNLAYLSVSPEGSHLFGASYANSRITVNPIGADGVALPATIVRDTGAHAHCAVVAPDARHLLVTSLGADCIHVFGWDGARGRLSAEPLRDIAVAAGAGPRHIVFHPGGRAAYLVNERDGTVEVFGYESGVLSSTGTHSLMPQGDPRTPWAADIQITPDGRFLYASERASHTICGFAVAPDGLRLRPVGSFPTEQEPRGFAIDPSGRCLIVAGNASGYVTCHRIDPASGALSRTDRRMVGQHPNWIEIAALQAG